MIHEWGKSHPHSCKHNSNNDDHDIYSHSRIDIPNFDGETPLMQAVQHRNLPLIEALLNCGADFHGPAFGQPSLLHWVYENGRALLHEACSRRGKTALVKALLEQGHMDPNCTIPNPEGGDPITPMMLAIAENDVETVELLIKHGAFVGESEKKAALPGKHSTELRSLLGVPEPAFSSDSDREDEQI